MVLGYLTLCSTNYHFCLFFQGSKVRFYVCHNIGLLLALSAKREIIAVIKRNRVQINFSCSGCILDECTKVKTHIGTNSPFFAHNTFLIS